MAKFAKVVAFAALRSDYRTTWFALGRTFLAVATLSELLFTPISALMHPVGGIAGPRCEPLPAISVFCIGDPSGPSTWRACVVGVMLIIVASGYQPRATAVLHLWATFSVATSITLPDGGDAIALIAVSLITPMCLCDDRRWQWSHPSTRMRPEYRVVCLPTQWAVRLQVAFIYAHSGLAKIGVDDWQNGSAFYYLVRDKMFGASGLDGRFWDWLSYYPLGTLTVSWGTILIELMLAVLISAGARYRRVALVLAIFLHTMIFLLIGLFSFSLVMISCVLLAVNPGCSRIGTTGDQEGNASGVSAGGSS